jgi:protein arginine N-methyltransferase 1
MSRADDPSELGQFIPLHYHYNMLNDAVRMRGFKAAIDFVVRPGSKVLELGGGTGVLSYFAIQKAAKVWCVERNPELVAKARQILSLNPPGDKVEIIEADAFDFLPPERVDVVICEMIHVAMLREKQIPVISSFKERYLTRFGKPLPSFVPEALIQAVQPVEHDFNFDGYYAPTPLFQDPHSTHPKTRELAAPMVYQLLAYHDPLPARCVWSGAINATQAGALNGLRFITKNILAVLPEKQTTIDWHSQYLIFPLSHPINVAQGDSIQIGFSYEAGASLSQLEDSLSATVQSVPRAYYIPPASAGAA